MCESWDFGQFSKKFDKKWTLEVADLVKKNFQKIQKNDENFFSLFLFLLCSIECIMFPRLDLMTQNQFYTRYIVREFVKSRYENDVKIYTNHQKVQKISKIFLMENSFYWCVLVMLE